MNTKAFQTVRLMGVAALTTLCLINSAQAQQAPLMPFTASELPIMAQTPNIIYGTYGPQVILDAPTFSELPVPIYLDKSLESILSPSLNSSSLTSGATEQVAPLQEALPTQAPNEQSIKEASSEGQLSAVEQEVPEKEDFLTENANQSSGANKQTDPVTAKPTFATQGLARVEQVNFIFNPLLKKENQVSPGTQALGIDAIKELARKQLETCQQAGYVCDAVVSLDGNALKIELTPLLLESVVVDGEGEKQKKALNSLLRWLRPDQPLELKEIERQLRLVQANPDLPISAQIEPIPYTHQARLRVTSTEKKNPNHLVATWNNLDQPIFGRQFGALTLVNNNLTGHGDSLMASVVQGYRSTAGFTRYEYPVTPALRPYIEGQMGWIRPFQEEYAAPGTDGWALRVSTGVKYVLLDKPRQRLSADVNFDFKQAYSYPDNTDVSLEREAVRTIRGGINYDQKWDSAAFSTRHEVAGGIPILSGSLSDDPKLSWFRGGSQYFRYTGYALLTKNLPLDSTLSLNTQWQFTPDGLTNFDVGGLGGTFYGRGYREVYLFVDSYTISSLQWQVPAKFIPKGWRLPFSSKDLRDTTSLLAFVDYGYGWISYPPAGTDDDEHIFSTGFGIRSQFTDRLIGRFDLGFPLLRQPPFQQNPRIHFGLDIVLL